MRYAFLVATLAFVPGAVFAQDVPPQAAAPTTPPLGQFGGMMPPQQGGAGGFGDRGNFGGGPGMMQSDDFGGRGGGQGFGAQNDFGGGMMGGQPNFDRGDGLRGIYDALKRPDGQGFDPQKVKDAIGMMGGQRLLQPQQGGAFATGTAPRGMMRSNGDQQGEQQFSPMQGKAPMMQRGGSFGDSSEQGGPSLDQMKQSTKGIEQGLGMVQKQIARLQKKGVAIPADITTLVDGLQKDLGTVQQVSDPTSDEAQNALQNLMDEGQSLRDIGPRLGLIERWPQMEKEANRQLANVQKQLTQGKAAAAKAGVDVSAIVAEITGAISDVQTALAAAKTSVGTADADMQDVSSSMRDDVLGPLQDLSKEVQILKDIANVNRAITRVVKHADSLKKSSASLKAKGKDTSKLDELIASIYQDASDAKAAYTSKDVQAQDIFDLVSSAESAGNDADQELANLRGVKTDTDRTLNGESNGAAANLSGFFSSLFGW